ITLPVPSPPASLVTQVVTSMVTVAWRTREVALPSRVALKSRLPQCLAQRVEAELLEGLRLGLARLSVVADRLVPDVEHPLPLRHDIVVLGRAIHGLGAIALGRVLDLRADPAAQVERAEDGGRPPAEAHRVLELIGPACRRRERPRQVLDARAEGERATPQRILEVSP